MASQNIISARAIDCSQVADWSREIGWDVDYQQLGRGTFDGRFSTAFCGRLRITNQFCNRELAVRGVPPRNMMSVALPTGVGYRGVFQGRGLGENEAIVLRPGDDGFLKSPRDLQMCTVSIPTDQLESALWHFGRCELSAVLPKSGAFLFPREVIRNLTEMLTAVTTPDVGLNGQSALLEVEDQILQAIDEGLCGQQRWTAGQDRVKYVRRARDYIDAHLGGVLRLSQIASSISVSSRTLELAFREVLGVTLVEYIRTRRLSRVRQLLLKPPRYHRPIGQLAMECGLAHLGYFSRDYKALFGELPSETLRRVKHM